MFRVASAKDVEQSPLPQSIQAYRSKSISSNAPMVTPSLSEPSTTTETSPNMTSNATLPKGDIESLSEESEEARLDRLGRARPEIFKSTTMEICFIFSVTMCQILTEFLVSGFTVILPTLIKALQIPAASAVWPASAFSLVIASTLLFFGRLGDMYGGYPVYIFGLAWMLVWCIIAGFSSSPLMLIFCRALQGLGAAAFLPASVMILGSVYRPGPRKNLVFSVYGTSAVLGYFLGILIAGIVGQFLYWGWYFWLASILIVITLISSIFAVPNDSLEKRQQINKIPMDYWGAATIVSGLVLLVFSITESVHAPQGWRTPYIPILLVVGILLFGLAAYIEGWVAEVPLLPGSIFKYKSMTALSFSMLLLYGNFAAFLVYGTLYFESFMGAKPLQVVAWYIPMVVGGIILSTVGGFLLHRLPPKPLLMLAGCGSCGSMLLLALIPEGGNYWAYIFPAMIFGTMAVDIAFNMTNIFMTTTLPSSQQGLAGGLVNTIVHFGIAIVLGLADIVQNETFKSHGLRDSYKAAFWFGTSAGALSLLIKTFLVKIPKLKSDYTADERRELEEEARKLEAEERPA